MLSHVRRLLDIVACTTCFAKSKDGGKSRKPPNSPANGKPSSAATSSPAMAGAGKDEKVQHEGDPVPAISEKFDMAAIYPPPKLGDFYEFFNFSHLQSPIQCGFFFSLCFFFVLLC